MKNECWAIDMGGGKSKVDILEDKSPTLTTTHYGEPAVVYVIDQQGGKGNCNITENVSPTILSYSHGTPHAVCYGCDLGTSRDVGALWLEECSKTLSNGTCPGHHNHVVICFDSYNMAETGEVTKTLNSAATDTDHLPIVCIEGNGSRPSHRGDGYIESEQMYTLNTTEVHGVCYCLQGAGVTSQGQQGIGVMEDLCYTLTDVDKHGVCYFFDHHPQDSRCTYEPDTANSVTSRYGTGGGKTPIVVEVIDGKSC